MPAEGSRMATSGSSDPTVNASADAAAACHGLDRSCGLMPSSASACAMNALRSVSLDRDFAGGSLRQSLPGVDRGQFLEFGLRIGGQLQAFLCQQGTLGVALAAD